MNPSESETPLPHRLVIYLPSRKKDETAIENFDRIAQVACNLLCERFGGVTSYPATGHFKKADGEIQRESVQVLEAFCEQANWQQEANYIKTLSAALAKQLAQESIACTVDGRMILVEPLEEWPSDNSSDANRILLSFNELNSPLTIE